MMKKNYKKERGFTVLETLIALAVIGLGIGGATLAIRGGLSASTLAKEQVRAFYLAQEAVEMIKNRRDANFLDTLTGGTRTWLMGITSIDPVAARGGCAIGSTCTMDVYNNYIGICSGSWGSCPVLLQNGSVEPAAYIYGYNAGWVSTKYRREVQFESINANEVAVVILVSWTHGTQTRNFITKTIITNWI